MEAEPAPVFVPIWNATVPEEPAPAMAFAQAGATAPQQPPETPWMQWPLDGYGLRDGYCGHGYMTEAVKAISAWAVVQKGVTRIEAETAPENTASQHVLMNAGFIPTGENGEEGPRFLYQNM